VLIETFNANLNLYVEDKIDNYTITMIEEITWCVMKKFKRWI